MSERLVVCLRWCGISSAPEADRPGFAAAAAEMARRATPHGARIVAWHASGLAFEFAADAIQNAVSLVTNPPMPDGFAAGIAQGELGGVIDGGLRVTLSHGPALVVATALARMARAGEVLVAPMCTAVQTGELVTAGSRLGVVAGRRVRGLRLDQKNPWRAAIADAVPSLAFSFARVGSLDPADLVFAPGTLAVVRADPGHGGSRLLADLAQSHGQAHLVVSAPPLGEPLGALRRAFARAPRRATDPGFSYEHASLLESLLAGEGLDVVDSATLLGAWFGAAPNGGLVLVDDAGEVDVDTLEALAQGCADGHLSLVARLGFADPLPVPLAELTLAGEVVIEDLSRDEALELAKQLCDGSLYDRAAARFVTSRGTTPLAVELSLCDGLESGALLWDRSRALLRARGSGRGPALSAGETVLRRLRLLDARKAQVVAVLAVLGGEAELGELTSVVTQLHGKFDLQQTLADLASARWLREEGDLVALPSRSHRTAILDDLPADALLSLHRTAAAMFEASSRPLAAGSAALHALLAGRGGDAERLARRAAASAEAVGLAATAEGLEDFARTRDHAPLWTRNLTGPWSWEAPPASRRFSALTEIGPASEDAPSGRAALALREGDLESIDEIVASLRQDNAASPLADRLEAMAGLARGETGAPLGLLRGAKERAAFAGSAERCRAALALGIALAAAGRETDALLEALDALARAREASDTRGEQACSRFLAQLSRGAGDELAAQQWERAVAG
jgi:hypothetical protein